MKNKHILISGAGIAGLTLAYWLKRYGFIPTLVEKHPSLRAGGYKIDIRGVALEVIKRMECHSAIRESRTDIRGATFVDRSGKQLTKISGDLAGYRKEGDLEINRGDLCQILWRALEGVECLFGDSVTALKENEHGVEVEFEQNSPRQFDLVIGADGLHSAVRKLAFGDESLFLRDLGLFVSVYTIPNFLHLDRWEIEYYEPQRYVNVYSTSGDQNAKANFAFPSCTMPSTQAEQQKMLEEAFQGVGWEVPRLLAAMKDSPDFYFDAAAQIHMPCLSKGRISLVGDAGYAPSPLAGQGTSVALVGAYVLAGELAEAKGDHTKAFQSYEKRIKHFVEKNQKLVSMSVSFTKENKPFSLAWLHDLLLRWLPESWIHFFKKLAVRRITKAANALTLKNYPPN